MRNEKRARRFCRRAFLVALKVKYGSVHCEGFQRAIADFVCFHCPLVAPAGATPLRNDKSQVWKCAPEGFQRAIGKPFGRLRRGETPATLKTKPHGENPLPAKQPSIRNAAHCLPKHMREQRHRAQDREYIRNRFGKENRKHRIRNEQRQQIHQRNQQNQLAQARQK